MIASHLPSAHTISVVLGVRETMRVGTPLNVTERPAPSVSVVPAADADVGATVGALVDCACTAVVGCGAAVGADAVGAGGALHAASININATSKSV